MTVKEDENILRTRIKLQMQRMGLSNNMLADKIGVDKSTISPKSFPTSRMTILSGGVNWVFFLCV